MKAPLLALTLALAATPALADPLGETLDAAGGALCFRQAEPGPAGQQWTSALASMTRNADGVPILRLRLEGKGKPLLVYSACAWSETINRGGGGRILDPTFLATSGVTCFMNSGSPDEEAGSFPVAWDNGETLQMHLPFTVAAWRDWDTRRKAGWPDVAEGDRIVRVTRAPADACAELNARFNPKG